MEKCVFKVGLRSTSPLSINQDGDLLLENDWTFISGTTLAGILRNYLDYLGKDTSSLFGSETKVSRIYIGDSYSQVVGVERRFSTAINSRTNSTEIGSLRINTYFKPGLEFELELRIDNYQPEDSDLIFRALRALDKGVIRIGLGKSSGLGLFRLFSIRREIYNLKDRGELIAYLKEDFKGQELIEKLWENNELEGICRFTLTGHFTSPFLIPGLEDYRDYGSEKRALKSQGRYIIPGKSLKGALRARMNLIEDYLGGEKLVDKIFGSGKESVSLSRIFLEEAYIEDPKNTLVYGRTKLDKFTGSPMKSALMRDYPILGGSNFNIVYRPIKDEETDTYILALIFLALRDLATENLALGSGRSLGRGRFKASKLFYKYNREKIIIDFENSTIENEELLEAYMASLGSGR